MAPVFFVFMLFGITFAVELLVAATFVLAAIIFCVAMLWTWMKRLMQILWPARAVLLLLLSTTMLAAQSEHGQWANMIGHVCWQGEEQTDQTSWPIHHHCTCHLICDPAPMEDKQCITYCGSRQCLCHVDQTCDAPIEPKL